MGIVDAALVEHNLARLDRDGRGAFVADLWEARGFETDRDGNTVEASDGDRTVRIRVLADGSTPDGDGDAVDAVVAPGGVDGSVDGVEVIDSATLAEMLDYAVDRPVARDLCARHFGAPPEKLEHPRRYGEGVGGVAVSLFGAVVVLLAVGAVLGFAGMPGPGDGTGGPAAGGSTPAADGPDPGIDDPSMADPGTAADERADGTPPGVTEGGIADLDALAAAHSATLEGQSHMVRFDRSRPRDLDPNRTRVRRDVDIAVEGGRYLARKTEVAGGNRTYLGAVYHERGVFYSADYNESARRHHRILRLDSRNVLVPTPYELRDSLVERYLSTPETRLNGTVDREEGTHYRIEGQGVPTRSALADVENYSVVALVDPRGLVRKVTVEYTNSVPGATYRTRLEITYGRLGETSVERPDWYDRRGSQDPSGANRPL